MTSSDFGADIFDDDAADRGDDERDASGAAGAVDEAGPDAGEEAATGDGDGSEADAAHQTAKATRKAGTTKKKTAAKAKSSRKKSERKKAARKTPSAHDDAGGEPVANEAFADARFAAEPVAEEPVTEEPVAEEPVAEGTIRNPFPATRRLDDDDEDLLDPFHSDVDLVERDLDRADLLAALAADEATEPRLDADGEPVAPDTLAAASADAGDGAPEAEDDEGPRRRRRRRRRRRGRSGADATDASRADADSATDFAEARDDTGDELFGEASPGGGAPRDVDDSFGDLDFGRPDFGRPDFDDADVDDTAPFDDRPEPDDDVPFEAEADDRELDDDVELAEVERARDRDFADGGAREGRRRDRRRRRRGRDDERADEPELDDERPRRPFQPAADRRVVAAERTPPVLGAEQHGLRVAVLLDLHHALAGARRLGGELAYGLLLQELSRRRHLIRAIAYGSPADHAEATVVGNGFEFRGVESNEGRLVAMCVDALSLASRVDCVVLVPGAEPLEPLLQSLDHTGVRVEVAEFVDEDHDLPARGLGGVRALGRECTFVP
ncbi:MAG: NYN domain-containing protein [Planctomycetes bacterium]|nr:NYN domain-containing protein [Planctomycetota bacterium]